MLNRVIQFSLRNRLLVVATAALVMVYGVRTILTLPIDVLPDLNRPSVTVFLEAGGLAPEEVETLVNFPVETALNGMPSVQRVRSTASVGLGLVFVEFEWGTDIYLDRQLVAEKLSLARTQLPASVTPVMGPISSVMGQIMLVGLTVDSPNASSDSLNTSSDFPNTSLDLPNTTLDTSADSIVSAMDLRTIADWTIRPRLLTISGVAQVIPIGGEVKQFQVLVSPVKLRELGLTLGDVESAMARSNANTTGGFIESQGQELLVRNIGRTTDLAEIRNTTVAFRGGVAVRLSDVGEVRLGARVKRGDGSLNGKSAVILSIEKQPNASTTDLTKNIDAALDDIQKTLPRGVHLDKEVFKQAYFIEAAIGNVEEALRDGTILVAIVLFLFLLNLRTTVITLTAIPLSFVMTAIVFSFFGLSVNTMTLGGLAVAIGELVDDAIVDVENVYRRLTENARKPKPDKVLQVIYAASSEVRNSIVFATVIVVLVFIPLFSLSGIEGRIFAPLGIAYIISILASLLVSLTVTPAMCSYLLNNPKFLAGQTDGVLVRWLKRQDERLLHFTLRHPSPVLIGAATAMALSVGSVFLMGSEFLPPFNEGSLTINLLLTPGTSLEESNRIGSVAEVLIRTVPEVVTTGRRTGRAELDEHAEGVHSSEIEVALRESTRKKATVIEDIREQLAQIPGVGINIGQPISHRLDHLLSGVRAQVAVKLYGDDLAALRRKASEIEAVISGVSGVVDLQTEKQVLIPQVRVKLNRTELAKAGLSSGQTAEALETALNGKVVSQILDGQKSYDFFLRFDSESRKDIEAIRKTLLYTPSGASVPLESVADVLLDAGPNQINREDVRRRIVVFCNVSGRDLGTTVDEIRNAVDEKVLLPEGYFVRYEGQFESQQEATRLIVLLSAFSLAGMFLTLYSHFKSARLVLQIMLNIPLALIGSVIAVFLTGGVFSVASLVGFVTLCGIASRNGIMMISHYLHLIQQEGEAFSEQMIIRGSLERLVPVLMTALTAGLGLIPLVLSAEAAGKEILHPVAVVILGGLISSTLLDIFVTPVVFFKFGKPAVEKYLAAHHESADWTTASADTNGDTSGNTGGEKNGADTTGHAVNGKVEISTTGNER